MKRKRQRSFTPDPAVEAKLRWRSGPAPWPEMEDDETFERGNEGNDEFWRGVEVGLRCARLCRRAAA